MKSFLSGIVSPAVLSLPVCGNGSVHCFLLFPLFPANRILLFPSPHRGPFGLTKVRLTGQDNSAPATAYTGISAYPDKSRSDMGSSPLRPSFLPDTQNCVPVWKDGFSPLPSADEVFPVSFSKTREVHLKRECHSEPT